MFAYCNNNPVNFNDTSGNMCGPATKGERIALIGGGFGGAVGFVDIRFIDALIDTIDNTAEKVVAWVDAQVRKTEYREYSVYVLTDPNDDNLVKYVGRTNDPIRRMNEHKNDLRHLQRKEYVMDVVLTGLTKDESTLWEQTLISGYSIAYLENARREIAVRNVGKFASYIGSVAEMLLDISSDSIEQLIIGR